MVKQTKFYQNSLFWIITFLILSIIIFLLCVFFNSLILSILNLSIKKPGKIIYETYFVILLGIVTQSILILSVLNIICCSVFLKNRDDLDSCRKLIKIMILINITAFYTWPWYLILLAINLLLYKTLDLEQKIYLFKKDEKVLEIKSLNQIGLLTLLILFISCIFIYYSLTGLLFTGQILWYQNNLSKTILVSTWVLILVLMLALLIIIQCAINIGVCSLLMNNFQLTNNQNPFLHYLILENLWSFWSIVGIISFIPISIFMFQKYQKLNFNTTLNMQ